MSTCIEFVRHSIALKIFASSEKTYFVKRALANARRILQPPENCLSTEKRQK